MPAAPTPPRIEVSIRILRDSTREAAAYADLCPDCGREMRTTAIATRCPACGYREEADSETRQGDLPLYI